MPAGLAARVLAAAAAEAQEPRPARARRAAVRRDRRGRWLRRPLLVGTAAIGLLVTSAVAALIVASAAFPVGLVVQAACVAVVVLLFSAPSRAWFAERTDWYPPAGPPGAPPPRDQAVRPPDPSQGQGKPPVW